MKKLTVFFLLNCLTSLLFSQGALIDDEVTFWSMDEMHATRGFLPTAVDLSNYAPYISTQNKSDCVAHAYGNAMAIGLAKLIKEEDKDVITASRPSPLQIYYYNRIAGDENCSFGLYPAQVANHLLSYGATAWTQVERQHGYYPFYPFVSWCNYYPPSPNADFEYTYKPKSVRRAMTTSSIKTSLYQGMAVVAGIPVTISFNNCSSATYEIPDFEEEYQGGHAITIVGYDDKLIDDRGYFKIMNSWGTTWGEDGYVWISYEDFNKLSYFAYSVDMGIRGKYGLFSSEVPDSGYGSASEEEMPSSNIKNGDTFSFEGREHTYMDPQAEGVDFQKANALFNSKLKMHKD